MPAPDITATATASRDVVFTFSTDAEGEAWRTNITGIFIGSNNINYFPYFTINAAGTIATDGRGWSAGSTFTFTIKSNGYRDVVKTVTIPSV
ncbi:hemoblobin-interacting domain-containing protein [Brevibacillus sp. NRS-1366]|uniref:hemoblobin-interacting domain-containing protein n=1 Tax=Brevibacillus sp. NRS-1366 TaxID=3233899 RepID=UPI003D1F2490